MVLGEHLRRWYVGYLRKKVDAPGEERLIRTVRGAGYALKGA
jgi:DNA-binding response OmpR family regulator